MKHYRLFALAFAVLGLTATAHADISASAWLVPDNGATLCADNAVIACIPGSAANATFTLADNALTTGFTSAGNNGTINAFILSVGAGLLTGPAFAGGATTSTLLNTPQTASGINFGACNSTNQNCGTIFEFTGTANFTTGEMFSANSDDGVTLYVGGTGASNIVFSSPGPSVNHVTNGIYTGPSGNLAFTFVYAECCTLPALFNTNLNAGGNVPEPASVVLFGTLLAGIAVGLRKRLA